MGAPTYGDCGAAGLRLHLSLVTSEIAQSWHFGPETSPVHLRMCCITNGLGHLS